MNIRYCLNSVYNCLPLSRLKLLEDVVLYRSCGPIHKVWLSGGHVFVGLNEGRKLVTFDSKTVNLIQDIETDGCLDLDLQCPVLTILAWPPSGVLVVLENGDIQHWVFGPDYQWQKQSELYICKNVGGVVRSVCLNVAQSSLYWCERVQRDYKHVFTLYKRAIKEDETTGESLKLGSVTCLIKNGCEGSMFPMGHGIAYIPGGSSISSVTMCVILCTLTGSVDVVVGGERFRLTDINAHTPIHYNQLVLGCVSQLHKQKGEPHVLKSCYMNSSQTVIQLYSDGTVVSIKPAHDNHPDRVQLTDVSTGGLTNIMSLRQCVGLVYQSEVRVYSLKTGVQVCTLTCMDGVDIEGACHSMFGNQQPGIYTENSLYLIQRERAHRHMDDQTLVKTGHYQTQAIQLSYLERMQKSTYDSSSSQAIEELRTKWQQSVGSTPSTKLTEIVEPYLKEYWNLENMLRDRCDHPNMIQDMDMTTVGKEVDRLLEPKTKLSNTSRQTQLLLLSQWYPVEVLQSLLERFDLSDDELSTSQTHKWQCILAAETANLAGSCDIPVPLFELMTHLLYRYKPDLLIKFLHRSQTVWDKKLGISAFIRRKQSLMIYERALRCISEPSVSRDVERAVLVHVHILLTSETEGCVLRSIRLLLKYEKWLEAIELYREKREGSRQAQLLYQMIVSALTQYEVLHKYADSIFPLMPSVNCTDIMQDGSREDSTPSILCTDDNSISMKSVSPYLTQSIQQQQQQ